MSDNRSIFIVVPAFNEGAVITNTIQDLLDRNYSVIVIDDGSTDNTHDNLKGLNIYYIRHLVNLGQGAALQTGLQYALKKNAEIIVTFDADGQHDPNDIPRMIALMKEKNAGIVFGSRFKTGAKGNVPLTRRIVLRIARFINYLVSGILLTDANNGLRVMSRDTAEKINITENRSTHSAQIQNLVKNNKIPYAECGVNIMYSEYSMGKGIRNISSVRILYELIMFKLFR